MEGVSVCMSVYGFSEYLPAQIESIIAQSTAISEIVVVEDFSGLVSPADYLNEIFSANNIRLVYLKLSMNVGPAEAFRLAISASTGDVIYLCDHDDIWEPNRIKNTIGYHAESSLVIANGAVFNSECIVGPSSIYSELNMSFMGNLYKNGVVGATLSVEGKFARELSNATSFYPMHDWVITSFSLLTHRPIVFVDECLIHYRRHSRTFTGVVKTSIYTKLKYRSFLLMSLLIAYVKLGSKTYREVT
jgi:glycosyltransferase involved in cell wall biosynthesis